MVKIRFKNLIILVLILIIAYFIIVYISSLNKSGSESSDQKLAYCYGQCSKLVSQTCANNPDAEKCAEEEGNKCRNTCDANN